MEIRSRSGGVHRNDNRVEYLVYILRCNPSASLFVVRPHSPYLATPDSLPRS